MQKAKGNDELFCASSFVHSLPPPSILFTPNIFPPKFDLPPSHILHFPFNFPIRMRYVNFQLLLRFFNIFLLILLLIQLPTFFDQIAQWREYFAHKSAERARLEAKNAEPKFYSPLILLRPLPAGSIRLEAVRLNELFARPQHKCADRRAVGGRKDSFFVCFQPELLSNGQKFGDALSVNGLKDPPMVGGNFELDLNASSWALVFPKRNRLVEAIQTDVFLQFMPELEEDGRVPRDRIGTMLEGREFDLAKLDLDTEMLAKRQRETNVRIELVEWILERLNAKQLLLTFRPGLDAKLTEREEEKEGEVLLAWYRFLYRIFFRWHFALLGVRSNGRCGQALQRFDPRHCEWRATFVHFADFYEAAELPAYGIGSPLEEKLRFLRFLLSAENDKGNCLTTNSKDEDGILPAICAENVDEQQEGPFFDLFIYFRYRPFSEEIDRSEFNALLEITNKMALFCPAFFLEDKNWIVDPNARLAHFNEGISHFGNKSMEMPWAQKVLPSFFLPLKPIDELFDSIGIKSFQRNVLLLDLDGAEWDVLATIVERRICEKWLRSFHQIAFRIRIWGMEEADNWRRFYLWFLRLEECKFSKAYSRKLDESTILITYRRVQIVGR